MVQHVSGIHIVNRKVGVPKQLSGITLVQRLPTRPPPSYLTPYSCSQCSCHLPPLSSYQLNAHAAFTMKNFVTSRIVTTRPLLYEYDTLLGVLPMGESYYDVEEARHCSTVRKEADYGDNDYANGGGNEATNKVNIVHSRMVCFLDHWIIWMLYRVMFVASFYFGTARAEAEHWTVLGLSLIFCVLASLFRQAANDSRISWSTVLLLPELFMLVSVLPIVANCVQ